MLTLEMQDEPQHVEVKACLASFEIGMTGQFLEEPASLRQVPRLELLLRDDHRGLHAGRCEPSDRHRLLEGALLEQTVDGRPLHLAETLEQ